MSIYIYVHATATPFDIYIYIYIIYVHIHVSHKYINHKEYKYYLLNNQMIHLEA